MKQLQTYNRYSQFIEMFGDFNNPAWRELRFVEFATVDVQMTTDFSKYADYPHIGIDVIEKNTGNIVGYRTVSEDGVKSGKYIFTPNHIIYSKIRPNLNKVATPSFFGLCSADAYPILPKEEVVRKEFLAMVLRSHVFLNYIIPFSQRTGMPKVNRVQVEGFTLRMPPLSEQDKFLAISRQADKSKFGGFKSQFIEMFTCKGFPILRWGELFDTKLGKMLDKNKQNPHDKTCQYLANINVQWGSFELDDLQTMTFNTSELQKFSISKGDLLICEGGDSGRCAVWEEENSHIKFQKAIHRARSKDKEVIDPYFVQYYLQYAKTNGLLNDYISKTTIEHLTGEKLNLIPVIVPPIYLQEQFLSFVRQADKSKLIA